MRIQLVQGVHWVRSQTTYELIWLQFDWLSLVFTPGMDPDNLMQWWQSRIYDDETEVKSTMKVGLSHDS